MRDALEAVYEELTKLGTDLQAWRAAAESAKRATEEARASGEALRAELLAQQRAEAARLTQMLEEERAARAELQAQLERERELRTRFEARIEQAIAAAAKVAPAPKVAPALVIEPPTYEMVVTGRDPNNRPRTMLFTPVKPVTGKAN